MHFQSLFANGMMSVFGMLTLSIIYRSMSLVDIGIYIFFLSILGLVDNLRAGFLTITIIKFVSGTDENRAKQIVGSAWFLALVISSFYLLVNIPTFFLSNLVTDKGLVLFLKYYGVISILSLPNFMGDCLVQADKRFDRVLLLRIFNQGSYTLFVFLLTIFDRLNLTNLIYAYISSNLFSSIMVLILNWARVSTIKFVKKEIVYELFHFGKYSMGTNIGSSLFSVTNTFVINFLIGPAALAMYNLAGKLLQIIEIPILSFVSSGMPILSAYYNRGEKSEMIHSLKKLIGMLTLTLIPIVLVAFMFAEPILHLIGGEKYINNEAPNLFRIFILIGLLYPIDRFFAIGVDVIHKPKINFYKILIMLTINILAVFSFMLIYHSVYSIAMASIPTTLSAIIITYYPLRNYHNFSILSIYQTGFAEIMVLLRKNFKDYKTGSR